MSKLFWRKQLLRGAIAVFTSILIVSGVGPSTPPISSTSLHSSQQHYISWWNSSSDALATSGGRSSGGSFGSSGGGSSSGGSSGSSGGGSSSGGSSYNYSNDSSSGSYSSGSSSNSTADLITGIAILGAFAVLLVWGALYEVYQSIDKLIHPEKYKRRQATAKAGLASNMALSAQYSEQANDTVTVTQVQVALLASAREVQERFNEISTEYDWATPGGLDNALKETVLTLLRSPEAWTHVSSTAKTLLTRERAKQYFDSLSVEERSKFEMESLVNVGGNIKQRAIVTKEDGPADYIVATLIVGTAHDQPLFETIHSADELDDALKQLGAIAPDYLMVYEMLWSPQDSNDSLTYEELLLNYPHMFQIC